MTSLLVVEDDPDTSLVYEMVAAMILEAEVSTIRDGRIALNYLQRAKPDIIILDLHLPHVSGIEILEFAKNNGIKVVLATADGRLAQELSEKADAVMVKPLEPDVLMRVVSRLIRD